MSKSKRRDTEAQTASRRKALKKLGMGGVILPISKAWQTPVVDSVVVPAHAQTSPY